MTSRDDGARKVLAGLNKRSAGDLAYYQVFNCATQLVAVSRKRAQGDTTTGAYNSPHGIAVLVRHVDRLAGLRLELG